MTVCMYFIHLSCMLQNMYIGATTVEEEPGVVIYHPGVTTQLTCDVNPGVGWIVNNVSYFVDQLRNGNIPGHNVNGSNILITSSPVNDSEYVCTDGTNNGGVYHIIVAGEYADLFYMYIAIMINYL